MAGIRLQNCDEEDVLLLPEVAAADKLDRSRRPEDEEENCFLWWDPMPLAVVAAVVRANIWMIF
jgi:hypothetical protein